MAQHVALEEVIFGLCCLLLGLHSVHMKATEREGVEKACFGYGGREYDQVGGGDSWGVEEALRWLPEMAFS